MCVCVCVCVCMSVSVRVCVEGDGLLFFVYLLRVSFCSLRSDISLPVLFNCWFVWAMLGFSSISLISVCILQAVAGSSPIVNVRLSPPASMPGIDEQVHDLESARSSLESAGLERLDASFRDAIRNAEARIEHAAVDFFSYSFGCCLAFGICKPFCK